VSWLQEENAHLRQAQTALLGELLSLRTELAAVSHRVGPPMAGPSAALVSVAHRAQELASGARVASGSSGQPVAHRFEVGHRAISLYGSADASVSSN
jgi:hypothetical protein